MKRVSVTVLLVLLVNITVQLEAQANVNQDSVTKLDFHLDKIRKETETGRLWGSGLLFAAGAGIGIGGTAIASANRSAIGSGADTATAVSVGTGLFFGGLGLLALLWKSDYETIPEEYLALPKNSGDELRAKVLFGESALQTLSDKSRFGRYLSAGVIGATGLGLLAVYASRPGPETQQNLYSGVLYLGTGLVEMLIETTPESSFRDYNTWKAGAAK